MSEKKPLSEKRQKPINFWAKKFAKNTSQSDPLKSASRKRRSTVVVYDNTKYDSLPMSGYNVKIPPGLSLYPSQKLIISKILNALKYRQNVLAESPTGSGKTMALLSSTCSWLANYRIQREDAKEKCPLHGSTATPNMEQDQKSMAVIKNEPVDQHPLTPMDNTLSDRLLTYEDELENDFVESSIGAAACFDEPLDEVKPKGCLCLPRARIYYGTRTHKQIAQVVKEFGRLPYAGVIKHTILGSREQFCINGDALNAPDTTNHCKDLQKSDGAGCIFRSNMRGKLEHPYNMRRHVENFAPIVFDIEDLKEGLSVGSPQVCPYFTSNRTLTNDADIIFCPFTYLVDPVIRNSSSVSIKDSIIILDEAHNIEDTCRSTASFTFHEKEISDAISSCEEKEKLVHEDLRNMQGDEEADDETFSKLVSMSRSFAVIIGLLKDLWEWFKHVAEDTINESKDKFTGLRTLTRNWSYLRQSLEEKFLRESLLSPLESARYIAIMEAMKSVNSEIGEDDRKQTDARYRPSSTLIVLVEKWMYFQTFFGKQDYMNTYRINATIEDGSNSGYYSQSTRIMGSSGPRNNLYNSIEDADTWLDSNRGYGCLQPVVEGSKTSVSLWCMSPALTFMDAFSDARSVVLASGTLSPMETLKTELGVEFKHQLEGRQVIPRERICASVISSGSSGNLINCTRDGLSKPHTIRDIADVIRDVCDVVPNGVLCFFSSYAVLNSIKSFMQSQGIINQISKRKKVFDEPRVSSRMNDIIEQFNHAIRFPKNGQNGALMFAVFRGKVSEGLDFADDLARAVISVGIPYPNFGDAQVLEKRKYNDEHAKVKHILDGEDWYKSQAYRALNQALGRCLRHKGDWGALILIDHRLAEQASVNQTARVNNLAPSSRVSTWIREQLIVYNNNYQGFLSQLDSFVNRLVFESQDGSYNS